MTVIYRDDWITLHCARWQDVDLPQCDAVITDPPYSERTHAGQRHGRMDPRYSEPWQMAVSSRGLGYEGMDRASAVDAAQRLSGLSRAWVCVMTSHDLVSSWEQGFESCERYTFAPIACVQHARNVRLAGDGPSNWSDHLIVSRPRGLRAWGALPGAYVGANHDAGENTFDRSKRIPGGKPLWLMRAIVRDYSRPGDLVIDPFCGSGTTALACRLEGRRCITVEQDPATAEIARRRISAMPVEQPTGQTAIAWE